MILAIDPGNTRSAYVLLGAQLEPMEFGIFENDLLLQTIQDMRDVGIADNTDFVIEMVASYGMAVGAEVFETCVWIGRFWQMAEDFKSRNRIYRMEEKINLCHDSRAKDGNIRQALIDRFGPVGTKKEPGWFYGVSKDVWAAIAVGVTWADKRVKP